MFWGKIRILWKQNRKEALVSNINNYDKETKKEKKHFTNYGTIFDSDPNL